MPKRPTVISSRIAFRGKACSIAVDELAEPGREKPRRREVVLHGPSAVILAFNDAEEVLMVRQYRHAARRFLWELPAGGVEPHETPAACARRELREETGYRARRWLRLARYFPAPGLLEEQMHVYWARELLPGLAQPEEDEQIEVRFFPARELAEQIRHGRIADGKTLSAWAAWLSVTGKG